MEAESSKIDKKENLKMAKSSVPAAKNRRKGSSAEEVEDSPVADKGNEGTPASGNRPSEVGIRPRFCCSYRFLIGCGAFLAFFNATLIRLGTIIAMVCMTIPHSRNMTSSVHCPPISHESSPRMYEFSWSSRLQGIINSGAFCGFLVGPFIGGFLAFRFGGKMVLFTATVGTVATLSLIPALTRVSPYFFFAIRIVNGFFGGWMFPSAFDILHHWSVPEERQYLFGGGLIGVPAFAVINFPLNGLICRYLGWSWIFYLSALWLASNAVFIYYFVYNYPEKCPYARSEMNYLISRISRPARRKPIPWRRIFRSKPIYSYFITHFCMNYGFITVVIHLPVFMREVHHFHLGSNSVLSASPYVAALVVRIITTLTFDRILRKLRVTKTVLRKSFFSAGVILPTASLVGITFFTCDYRKIIIYFFILYAAALELGMASGYLLSLVDMCPGYNNILSGFANAIASSAGLISSLLTGAFIPNGTHEEWSRAFYVTVGVLVLGGFVFLVFGTSELQPWGTGEPEREERNVK